MLLRKETVRIINTKHRSIFDLDILGKARTMEIDHWRHDTRWWINGDDLEAKDAQQDGLPKTTRSRSSTSSDRFVRSHCYHQYSAQPQKQIAAYFWIFKSSTKFPSRRIKNQFNRRFLQAGMAKTLKVVHSENFWTAQRQKWNGHSSLVWTRLKMNDHSLVN